MASKKNIKIENKWYGLTSGIPEPQAYGANIITSEAAR